MPQYLHPGVYIEELPSARTIQGASTSVPAFIGYTETGPVDVPTLITSWQSYQRQFGSALWYAFNSWAVYEFFAEGGGACYVVRTFDPAAPPAAATIGSIELAAASPGLWGNSLMAMVANAEGDPGAAPLSDPSPLFSVRLVVDAAKIDGPAQPDLPNRLLVAFARDNRLDTVMLGGIAYYVLETFEATEAALNSGEFAARVNSSSIFMRVTAPLDGSGTMVARPPNSEAPVAFSGGANAAYDYPAAVGLLQEVRGISLLAIPDIPAIADTFGNPDLGAQAATIDSVMILAERMANIFYVVDPPYGLSVLDMLSFVGGSPPDAAALSSSYSAIYYPWLHMLYPPTGATIAIPPSGPVLGRYVDTDLSIGVFKAPAGLAQGLLQTIVEVDERVADNEQDLLNSRGINAVRMFVNSGPAIWGARTLSQDRTWTYISVRRLFLYVEQSIGNSLQWVAFEPNDQRLWAAVNHDVSAFLSILWLQGGLFGATPKDAFFVICDETNNPPEACSQGILSIDVGLAALYPAEFVMIRITRKTALSDPSA